MQLNIQSVFSDHEAWLLFRLAAFGEAIGWSLLITGILLKRFVFHGNDTAVLIAGQLHGSLFLIYIVACVVLYPSLRWKYSRTILAGLASVPPFGSLVFEQYMAYTRLWGQYQQRQAIMAYWLIIG